MTEYTVRLFNPGGHVLGFFHSQTDTLADACAVARDLLIINGEAEIWQGAECVGRVCLVHPGAHARA